jgi:hypothetical protein
MRKLDIGRSDMTGSKADRRSREERHEARIEHAMKDAEKMNAVHEKRREVFEDLRRALLVDELALYDVDIAVVMSRQTIYRWRGSGIHIGYVACTIECRARRLTADSFMRMSQTAEAHDCSIALAPGYGSRKAGFIYIEIESKDESLSDSMVDEDEF